MEHQRTPAGLALAIRRGFNPPMMMAPAANTPEDFHEPEAPEGGSSRVDLAPGMSVPGGVLRFAFSRSSGPGGQNVNKRSTKAELRVMPGDLPLSPGVQHRFLEQARGYLTSEGEVLIVSDEHRTQLRNREACVDRLRSLIVAAMVVPKVRKKTKPSRGARERRLTAKRVRSQTKARRRERED